MKIYDDKMVTHVFYDAEFTSLTRDGEFISIGMVTKNGDCFYAEFTDYDRSKVTPWLQEHVIDNLILDEDYENPSIDRLSQQYISHIMHNVIIRGTRDTVKEYLEQWLHLQSQSSHDIIKIKPIQFYCDCYAYDWMLLNDLLCTDGNALNTPEYMSYIPIDLSTLLYTVGLNPDISREDLLGRLNVNHLVEVIRSMKFRGISLDSRDMKHNSLYDACICRSCFNMISDRFL